MAFRVARVPLDDGFNAPDGRWRGNVDPENLAVIIRLFITVAIRIGFGNTFVR